MVSFTSSLVIMNTALHSLLTRLLKHTHIHLVEVVSALFGCLLSWMKYMCSDKDEERKQKEMKQPALLHAPQTDPPAVWSDLDHLRASAAARRCQTAGRETVSANMRDRAETGWKEKI